MDNSNYDNRHSNDMRDFLTVVFKHKKLISTVFITVVMTVTIGSFLMAPVYLAESTILVKIGTEYLNKSLVGNNVPVMSLSQEEIINSEIQILNNKDLIEKVITSIKVDKIYPELLNNPPEMVNPLDAAVNIFQKNLTIEAVKKSNIIKVSFKHKDPRIAASVLNLLIELFKEKHLQILSDPKSSFLEMQLVAYDQKLKESENNLQSFKQKAGVFSLDEQRSLLLRQRSELDTEFKNTQKTISEMHKRVITLKEQMKILSESKTRHTSTQRDTIIADAKAKLLALQLNEQALSKKYTASNRLVVNARKEIQMVMDNLKEQEEEISSKVKTEDKVYQNTEIELLKAETELNAQKGKATVLSQQLAEVNGKVRALDYSEKDIQKLKREQVINEKNYQTYSEKAEEARITDDMNRLKMANISVIQKAAAPAEPVKPKKVMNVVLGLVFGLFSGLGLAFIRESASMSFSAPEKVENRLGLPVLATISFKEG